MFLEIEVVKLLYVKIQAEISQGDSYENSEGSCTICNIFTENTSINRISSTRSE